MIITKPERTMKKKSSSATSILWPLLLATILLPPTSRARLLEPTSDPAVLAHLCRAHWAHQAHNHHHHRHHHHRLHHLAMHHQPPSWCLRFPQTQLPPPPPPPPPPSGEEIDPRYGVEKRLVPTGPNPLHN